MVKKKTGGNKNKKKKNETLNQVVERELVFKEENQEYAHITKLYGSCRVEAECVDGKNRLCIIRGTIKRKVRFKLNDVILVSLREFENNKCDIIYQYTPSEVNELKRLDEIPETYGLNSFVENVNDNNIVFTKDDDIDDDEDEPKEYTEDLDFEEI
jgi:translation initiation factor 1A